MSKSKNPPPKSTERSPAEAQAERSADKKISAGDERDHAGNAVAGNKQEPADQVNGGPDNGGNHEPNNQAENVWRKAMREPLIIFTGILAICNVVLVVATIALAVSTFGLRNATYALTAETEGVKNATQQLSSTTAGIKTANENLVTATNRLATATDELVKYAKEQTSDMKSAIDAAKNSADAARSMAESASTNIDILREQFGLQKAGAERQMAHIDIPSVEIARFDTYTNGVIEAHIQVRNSGPTTAENVRIAARMIVANRGANPCRVDATGALPASIGPNADYPSSARANVTPEQRQRIVDGMSAIFVYGRVNYVDAAKANRFRNFRLMWSGSSNDPVFKLTHTDGCNDGN